MRKFINNVVFILKGSQHACTAGCICLLWPGHYACCSCSPPHLGSVARIPWGSFLLVPAAFCLSSIGPQLVFAMYLLSSNTGFQPWVLYLGQEPNFVSIWLSFRFATMSHYHDWKE